MHEEYYTPHFNSSDSVRDTIIRYARVVPYKCTPLWNGGECGYHVPGTNTPTEIVETPSEPPKRFLKLRSGMSGRCHVQDLAAKRSPHSPDGSSAADYWKTLQNLSLIHI